MPQKNSNNPEKDLARQIGALADRAPEAPALPRPIRAIKYLETGSWNWMGLARVVWCWWAFLWGNAADKAEARAILVDWFRRQEREGDMLDETWTASHFELYIIIGSGARKLALLMNDPELLDLTAAWWCRQEALADLSWVPQDGKAGNSLLPHARAGHGGVSQAVAVAHQLLRGLPLDPATRDPNWWASEDMLGCRLLRDLLAAGDTLTVSGGQSAAVPQGLSAKTAAIEQLPSTAPLLMSPIRVERREDGSYRAVVLEKRAGTDWCLWTAWDAAKGRQVHGDGNKKPRVPTSAPDLAGAGPVTAYTIGPSGWSREGASPVEPSPPVQPAAAPARRSPAAIGADLERLERSLREIAKVRPAARAAVTQAADILQPLVAEVAALEPPLAVK